MLKHITLAALTSFALMTAVALPAQAAPSAADCSYYRHLYNQDIYAGAGDKSNYNWYAVQLQQCSASGN